jgi:hypothetical protein
MDADSSDGARRFPRPFRRLAGGGSKPVAELKRRIAAQYAGDAFVGGRFLSLVEHYDGLAHADQNAYFGMQNLAIAATATTTFLLGLADYLKHSPHLHVYQIGALGTSLLATVLAGVLKSFNYQAKWVAFRTLREALIAEFYRFDVGIAPYPAPGDTKQFAARVDALMADANAKWSALQAPTPDAK